MKIFGIGFHKTGTKSLAHALATLGYRVTGPNGVLDPDIATNVARYVDELTPQFDAFQDNPWPIVFRDLDARFPGSRFILTVRDSAAWIRSVVEHFGRQDTPMRTWIYGVGHPHGHEATYVRRYEEHNRAVLRHFQDRPGDLLVLHVAAGDGWEKLCPFLGHGIPAIPFPHANAAADRAAPRAGADPTAGAGDHRPPGT